MKDKIAISKSLNNIAMINMDMKHHAMALDYYFKALKLMEENKTINDQAITMTNIGITYNQMKDNDKAITWYLKSLELFNQFTDNRNKSRLFVCLGISYTELKKYEKAESYLEQGLELAKKLGYIDMIALNYKYLADLYLEIGDFKKTLDFKNLYFDIKDSVFTQAYYKTLIDLQTRIDSDNTQREAALMKEKSALMFLIFIILGLALIIIIVVLYLKYSAKKHANMALNKLNFSNYEANIAIEKLILWSNYQNGTFKFDSKPNDLLGEINKCIMQSKQNIESKKIEITNSASQNMMVWVDSTALNMIIRDLILSAIKITPIGEKVTISSTSKGEFIEVSFAFSALSIKTDEISKLFALNIQQVIADKQNGENLGLSLCKEFVEKSGGSIWVEQTPGKNVEIKFTLPVKS
jgi:tetratricopeptide (TPR) repeat protein